MLLASRQVFPASHAPLRGFPVPKSCESGLSPELPYFFLPADGFCDKELPAADFDALLVRPSFKTDDAALAALGEVTFAGALVWESALPAAVFEVNPALPLRRVLEALLAAFGLVTFDFAIMVSLLWLVVR